MKNIILEMHSLEWNFIFKKVINLMYLKEHLREPSLGFHVE